MKVNKDVCIGCGSCVGSCPVEAISLVDGKAEIPEYYSKVAEFDKWFRLYDDERRVMNVHADKINVYRAGEYGCIIQIIVWIAVCRHDTCECVIVRNIRILIYLISES